MSIPLILGTYPWHPAQDAVSLGRLAHHRPLRAAQATHPGARRSCSMQHAACCTQGLTSPRFVACCEHARRALRASVTEAGTTISDRLLRVNVLPTAAAVLHLRRRLQRL